MQELWMEVKMINMNPERELIGFLVRHGELRIGENRWDGWGNFNLSLEGRESLEKTAQWLSFHRIGRVISSDLPRAVQSAEIIMQGCNVACPYTACDPNLRSWAIGWFTGKEKTPERKDEFRKYMKNPDLVIPEGESHNQFEKRVVVIDQYLATPYDGLPTVIVLHNSVIKARLGIDHGGDVLDPGGVMAVYLTESGAFDFEIVLGDTDFDFKRGLESGEWTHNPQNTKMGLYGDS